MHVSLSGYKGVVGREKCNEDDGGDLANVGDLAALVSGIANRSQSMRLENGGN